MVRILFRVDSDSLQRVGMTGLSFREAWDEKSTIGSLWLG